MAKVRIHEQEQALSAYFSDMLAEPKPRPVAPSPAQQEVTPDSAPQHESTELEPTLQQAEVVSQEDPNTLSTNAAAERPAVHKLLFCEIAGMRLAIAVSALNNIVQWPQQGLKQIPDQADWQLGLLSDPRQDCKVVDIRAMLQAPDSHSPVSQTYILLVDDRRHGIACDRIEQIVNVEERAVDWFQDRSQRPWLPGIISDTMHTIVDIPALLAVLDTGEMA